MSCSTKLRQIFLHTFSAKNHAIIDRFSLTSRSILERLNWHRDADNVSCTNWHQHRLTSRGKLQECRRDDCSENHWKRLSRLCQSAAAFQGSRDVGQDSVSSSSAVVMICTVIPTDSVTRVILSSKSLSSKYDIRSTSNFLHSTWDISVLSVSRTTTRMILTTYFCSDRSKLFICLDTRDPFDHSWNRSRSAWWEVKIHPSWLPIRRHFFIAEGFCPEGVVCSIPSWLGDRSHRSTRHGIQWSLKRWTPAQWTKTEISHVTTESCV